MFLDHGEVPAPGFIVRQPELAQTLEALAAKDRDGFYAGDVAQRLVAGVQMGGGIWELEDLAGYRIVEREPARLYLPQRAASPAHRCHPSGGLMLTEALQILERFPLGDLPGAQRNHLWSRRCAAATRIAPGIWAIPLRDAAGRPRHARLRR